MMVCPPNYSLPENVHWPSYVDEVEIVGPNLSGPTADGDLPSTVPDRIARAVALLWRHRGDFARALALLPAVALGLRRRGYRSTMERLLDRRNRRPGAAPARARPGDPVATGLGVAFVVRQAALVLPDATCLRKAVVLHHLLARRGIESTVRLGAKRAAADDDLAFHAWVEVGDVVVSEPADAVADFVVLDETPDPGHR
jgi:hypothetical protein